MKSIIRQLIIVVVAVGMLTGLKLSDRLDAHVYERMVYWTVFGVSALTALGYACNGSGIVAAMKAVLDVLYGARKLIAGILGMMMVWVALLVGKLDGATFAMLFGSIILTVIGGNVLAKKFSPESLSAARQTTVKVGEAGEVNVREEASL